MKASGIHTSRSFRSYLTRFTLSKGTQRAASKKEKVYIKGKLIPVFINEYWTSKQRQAHSLHEVSYRACFKPQLPRFFIETLTMPGDTVYDPFSGRGTTIIEASLLGRNSIANDVNPLSAVLARPRIAPPLLSDIADRLQKIPAQPKQMPEIDLSMFYHSDTLAEIVALKEFLNKSPNDPVNAWIRMVATNRLTGHSKGFFSVYTLPPNQAASQSRQRKINLIRKQRPEYRDTHAIILKKSRQLLRDIEDVQLRSLSKVARRAKFLTHDARKTSSIRSSSVHLTVTSPPFLNIVQYAQDNWLRCWFNGLDAEKIGRTITMSSTIERWIDVMSEVFKELYRITKRQGWIVFEVGEVRKGKVRLEECVVEMGLNAGFHCEAIMINSQKFTKTANIWGISNNKRGTNTNRIVIFQKS